MTPMISRQKLLQALPAIERYAAAVLAVVLTLAIRLALAPMLGTHAPYMFLILTIVIVTRLWGRGPGLLATVLGGICAWYFIIEPRFAFAIVDRIDALNLAGYFAVGVSISFLGEASGRLPATRSIGGRTKLRVIRQTAVLAGAAAVLAGMVLLLQRDFERTREAEGWVVHTYQVINSAQSLLSTTKDAERGERGYLLTGDESYLAPYDSAMAALPRGLNELKHLTSDNPDQQARWVEINRLTSERMGVLKRAVELRKASEVDAALALVRSGEGEQAMEALRSALDDIMRDERQLLEERKAEAKFQASRGRWILGLGSGALVLLLVFASVVIERETVRREKITQALRRHADLLEQAHDSLITWPLGRAIDYWSRGAETLYGYTREEAMGRSSHELLQTSHPLGMAQVDALLERDGEWNGELSQTTKDGRKLIVEGQWTLAVDAKGNKTVLEANRDITERKRAEEALRASESRFRLLFETNVAAIIRNTLDGRIVECNAAAARTFGYESPQEMRGLNTYDLHWKPEKREELIARLQAEKTLLGVEIKFRHKDGTPIWLIVNLCLTPAEDAGNTFIQGTLVDITERKRGEQELRRVNRALQTLSECDQVLVRAREESHLLDDICGILVQVGGYRMAWVGYGEHDEGKSVHPVAHAGVEEGYLQTANINWGDTERGRGPVGTAIRTARPVIARNIQTEPNLVPWREDARKRGYASLISLPILLGDQVLGTLSIYSEEADAFDSAEVQLLKQLSDDLAYGIQALRTRAERQRGEEALSREHNLLRALIDNLPDYVYVKDTEGRFLIANTGLARLIGAAQGQDLQGKTAADIFPKELGEMYHSAGLEVIRSGQPMINHEETTIDIDGDMRWVLTTNVPFRDNLGKIVGLVGISRDITERKQAEAENHLLATAIEQASETVVVTNRDAKIEYVNPAFTRTTGYTRSEALGQNPRVVKSGLHDAGFYQKLWATLTAGKLWRGEFTNRHKDGTLYMEEATIAPVRDAHGEITNYIAIKSNVTERKRAEEALRQSDQRYKDFISHSNEGVWRIELENPIPIDLPEEEIWERFAQNAYMAECNLAHARNLGFSSIEEIVGAPLRDLVSPSDQERLESYRSATRGGLRNRTVEFQSRDKAGNCKHFLRTEIPIIEDGMLVRMWGITRDVTELRQAEEALKRSEYLLRESQRVGRIGSYELDLASGRFTTSAITDEIFGVATDYPKDLNGWLRLVHSDQKEEMSAFLQQAIAEKQRAERVFHIVRQSDGAERWVAGNGDLVLDSQSHPVKVIGTIQDITEARQAEEALKESELRFRQLFERSESGVALHEAVLDAQGSISGYRCLDINPACERIMGVSRSQVLGRCAHEVFPELGEFCSRLFGQVAAAIAPVPFEDYSRTMGRYFAGSAYSPRPNQFAVSFMDVTERKRAEHHIRRLNVELEERVRSRTAALEAANRELESFAHSVSHDLRAPLRGIDGWSLALLEDYGERLDAQGNKYLTRVRSEAQRMGRLIDDLLHLSRVTRAELLPRSVDLTSLVETIVARLKEANPARSIEFIVAPQLKCTGDAPLLEIALTNLLDNAVKFTAPRNPARVEFGQAEYQSNPAFFVRDNGVGFDMAYAGMLFSPFQRLHKNSEFPGTGIGLATAQRVIHRHGGRIWAEAQVDVGATLYFTVGENKL